MDYSKLLQNVLDIAEEMLVAGAEVNRVEDSVERMISAYGCPFDRVNVFIITTNIQTTFEDPDGNIITHIRRVKRNDTNFDRLDYLNNLSRYICENTPDLDEIRERYLEVMARPQHSLHVKYLSAAAVAGAFTVFFGGSFFDGLCAFLIGLLMVFLQRYLRKFNENQLALTFTTAFISSLVTVILFSGGLANMNYILIGQIMLLIPGLALTNSVRDMLLGDIATGSVRLLNALVTAGAIGLGVAPNLALTKLFAKWISIDLSIPFLSFTERTGVYMYSVMIIMAFLGTLGYSLMCNTSRRQSVLGGIGGAIAWAIYLLLNQATGGTFIPIVIASMFVGFYAEIMAKKNKAPATIFITASSIVMVPGSALYYFVERLIEGDYVVAFEYGRSALSVAIAISIGLVFAVIINRYYLKIRSGGKNA